MAIDQAHRQANDGAFEEVIVLVSVVNGSPRSHGATAAILKEIRDYLSNRYRVDVFYVDLAKIDMRFCKGCLACYRTGKCAIADDVEAVSTRVKESDGIVIGSPTYGSNVSGLLKNFMDRGHFIVEQSLRGKHSFGVVTEEIADGNQVMRLVQISIKDEWRFLELGSSRLKK